MKTALILASLLAVGCAARPELLVTVDAISSDENSRKTTYVLLPGNKNLSPEDLQFREFAQYVHRALAARGFCRVDDIRQAQLAIILFYGISDPQEHYSTYSIPIWGQTGVSSASTSGTVNFFGNMGTYSSTTTYTPTYGITGFYSGIRRYVTYFRFMVLSACDVAAYIETHKIRELWRISAASTGSCGDLRVVFPVLVAASWQYIGQNTGQQVRVRLHEDDPLVLEVKGTTTRNKPSPSTRGMMQDKETSDD